MLRNMSRNAGQAGVRKSIALGAALLFLHASGYVAGRMNAANVPSKQKIRGYITARIDAQKVAILSDHIRVPSEGKVFRHDSSGDHPIASGDLRPGMLIQAEGSWTTHHQFAAQKVEVDAGVLEKEIHNSSYLQEEPTEVAKIKNGETAELAADGEWLMLSARTKREWAAQEAGVMPVSNAGVATGSEALTGLAMVSSMAGRRVSYTGIRQSDGRIAAERVELGSAAPADAYKLPHGIEVVRGKDPQTGIANLEFRRGKKVDGRLKLFADERVQQYVTRLGDSLLPAGAKGTSKHLEFRFFVIEDSSINAAALPDGTVLVNTGLLGAVQNEAQLAFILSHEIAHVLQVHHWREVHETRVQRVSLLIAGIAASYYVGDVGLFLSGLGMAAVVNGHQRTLENQADRLGLQNIIEHGYDPRPAPDFMTLMIERYRDRSTSKVWSDHDSSLLRGSFLTVQLAQQYPEKHFDGTRVNSEGFDEMREAMGPVKIE